MGAATDDAQRGRGAPTPGTIPPLGWKDVALRVKTQVGENHLSIIAAGVAFYLLLAFVPALAALVALYGMLGDPQAIGERVAALAGVLPAEAMALIEEQLRRLAATPRGALGAGALFGIALSVWSGTRGTRALIDSLNVAYDERESRGFIHLNLLALALTLALVVFVLVALALVAVLPLALARLGLDGALERTIALARWPLLLLFLMTVLAVLYRYAPDRDEPRWRWVSPGAASAALLWLLGSAAFSAYVSRSDSYHATYGSLGGVAVMMIWLFVGAFAVLLGAQLNAETERQTRHDSTEGAAEPMGRRRAHAADSLGESGSGR